jgi:hypothetical protein
MTPHPARLRGRLRVAERRLARAQDDRDRTIECGGWPGFAQREVDAALARVTAIHRALAVEAA